MNISTNTQNAPRLETFADYFRHTERYVKDSLLWARTPMQLETAQVRLRYFTRFNEKSHQSEIETRAFWSFRKNLAFEDNGISCD